MTEQDKKYIAFVLKCNWGKKVPERVFYDQGIKELKRYFFEIYSSVIKERGADLLVTDKERKVLSHLFNWAICSPDFKGDLQKGLYLASGQGFGKDVLITTIIRFLAEFDFNFRRFTHDDFLMNWFEKVPAFFNGLIAINDIDEYGKLKKHREAIPFLELLNYREQINSRRGLIVSTNYKPDILQKALEHDRPVKKLEQRIIECFNIVMILNADSKRRESKIEL